MPWPLTARAPAPKDGLSTPGWGLFFGACSAILSWRLECFLSLPDIGSWMMRGDMASIKAQRG